MNNVVPFPTRNTRPDRPETPTPPQVDDRPEAAVRTVRTAGGTSSPIERAVYTVKETAELLSLSLGSTYALIRTGDIPATKLGGRWVVPKRRFHDWLDNLPEATDDDVRRELDRLDRADNRRRYGA